VRRVALSIALKASCNVDDIHEAVQFDH